MSGKLYLILTPLDENEGFNVLPTYISEILKTLRIFIVEDVRTARRFLRKMDSKFPIDDSKFHILNEHSKPEDILSFLDEIKTQNIGLLSEAGVPCVADPGSLIVQQAHKKNIQVVPLVGPSSILLAMMASGMNGQNFSFNGYLPVNKNDRIKALKYLEKRALTENQSQIFIETPYRNQHVLNDIIEACTSQTMVCIAIDITLPSEKIVTKSIAEWKNNLPDLNKKPVIFIIGK